MTDQTVPDQESSGQTAAEDLTARLRAWSPSQCWSCGEWGCTNAAGHDIHCIGTDACECDDGECTCVCAECGSDEVCDCDCHLNLSDAAADEIERLRADNERLLQILRRSLPKRPGALGDIGDEPLVDDVTHPMHAELTTVEAADILNVSRPFLIKQIEVGHLPHHMVGTHRRLRLADVLAYRNRTDTEAEDALAAMTAEAEALGLYDE